MRTLTNLATSALPYFGSGKISRLGTSLRRGMGDFRNSGGLGFLRAVLGSALLAVLDALGIERAAHDVVAHAGQVFHPASPDQHHRVLLQIVAFPADVADQDRKSTRLNSSHSQISYAVFCLKKKKIVCVIMCVRIHSAPI